MKYTATLVLGAVISGIAYGSGITVSTMEEAYDGVDFIYEVKVTDVSKPDHGYTGNEPYTIEFGFEMISTLKGETTTRRKATYTLPAIAERFDEGDREYVLRSWHKLLASGKERAMSKNGNYLIYVQSDGIQEDKDVIRVVRIDPASEKEHLKKLIQMKANPQRTNSADRK